MFWINIKRIWRSGFVSFWRNRFVSLSAILAMTMALFVISAVIFLTAIFNFTLTQIRDKVDVNVYLTTGAEETDVLNIKKALEGLSGVKTVVYTSSAKALADFRERHKNDEQILQSLELLDSNPLGAALNIRTNDPSQYENVSNFLNTNNFLGKDKESIIYRVDYSENKIAIDRLMKITDLANKFGFGLAILFILISIIVTLNTIRLVIYISKAEISVMRLVGASSKYVKGPFIVGGLIYGFVATTIVTILLFPITYWLGQIAQNYLSGLNLFSFYLLHFFSIFAVLLVSSLLIGTVSATFAVRRFLKH